MRAERRCRPAAATDAGSHPAAGETALDRRDVETGFTNSRLELIFGVRPRGAEQRPVQLPVLVPILFERTASGLMGANRFRVQLVDRESRERRTGSCLDV